MAQGGLRSLTQPCLLWRREAIIQRGVLFGAINQRGVLFGAVCQVGGQLVGGL